MLLPTPERCEERWMIRFLTIRLARMAFSLLAVSIITFGLLQLVPGSFSDLSGANVGSGLGDGTVFTENSAGSGQQPAWSAYFDFMRGALTWNMPPSFKYPQLTVDQIIEQAFPVSLTLAALATLLTLVVAVPLGLLAAVRKDSVLDYGSMFLVTSGAALPGYLASLVLILLFSSWLGWLPSGGWSSPKNMIIPVSALALAPAATLARYVRSSVLEALGEDYVLAAYAKGGSKFVVLTRHVLRNSLIPLVTVVGPMFAHLATGTVFVEALLGIPGLGQFFAVGARTRDMPLLMGATLFFALLLMVMNLLVDLTYRLLDPRVRHQAVSGRPKVRRVEAVAVSQGGVA
jgi:ABC-type dipeptide/oligopeptide/nickel transport system permease component